MNEFNLPDDMTADEMGELLRLYLDETEEQLDALVQSLLSLEGDPGDSRQLDEAFRLLHSIKGSSALLGLDRITALTHHLESHFVQLRSGRRTLDARTMAVVLKCIDFLRACNGQLRSGEPLGSDLELLEQVRALERGEDGGTPSRPSSAVGSPASSPPVPAAAAADRSWCIEIDFVPGLPLADLKAELVLTRLSAVGTVVASSPSREQLSGAVDLSRLRVELRTSAEAATIEAAANADGVERVVVVDGDAAGATSAVVITDHADARPSEPADDTESAAGPRRESVTGAAVQPGETLRIDVDRLDVLLNLAGELLVTRARISQLLDTLGPLFRKAGHAGRSSLVADGIREIIHDLEGGGRVDPSALAPEMAALVEVLRQQTDAWNDGRRTFSDLVAVVDQLTRVTKSLQRGVLSTRMVPVGPLFGRFRRSVRDIAGELGKKVALEIAGDKTEVDKRMIDELGDPLNHLIRNSIDHGIESADVRRRLGKPETACVRLTAAHRGNSVIISVEDDGGGIDVDRIRRTAVERGLIAAEKADTLDEAEVVELIWEPGFSTKQQVSAVSGRGVGMDIVRTKIRQLNGSVGVASVRGQGTTFTITLPLTLTITRCMLFRVPQAVFAAPIESVREIVSLADHRVVTVNGRELCDVRGEFLPLVGIDDLFAWSGPRPSTAGGDGAGSVVVLRTNNRGFGLKVDALLGGYDLVVKPLDENYQHVRGLGGASILGDGSVCLLLDVATCVDFALPQKSAKATARDPHHRASGGGPAMP